MSKSVPSYNTYDLIDRYQAHRYPEGDRTYPRDYAHQPPPYHHAIPSSKSYHGGSISGQFYPGYCNDGGSRRANPDYYHMFNSWLLTQPPFTSPWNDEKAGVVGLNQSPLLTPTLTTRHQPNLLSSTPIAFPSTRFVFAAVPNRAQLQSQTTERLSLRARKKIRRGVQSAIVDIHEKAQPPDISSHPDVMPFSSSLKYVPVSNSCHISTQMSTQQSPSVSSSLSSLRLNSSCKSSTDHTSSCHRLVRPFSTPDGIRPLLSVVTAPDDDRIHTHSRIVTSIEEPGLTSVVCGTIGIQELEAVYQLVDHVIEADFKGTCLMVLLIVKNVFLIVHIC
uniref:Velvet domain-containing protein n=1 Tax=Heterorhabditis bacteriophora TaxID=37862 RepID=A0A1I7XTN9_HETBA